MSRSLQIRRPKTVPATDLTRPSKNAHDVTVVETPIGRRRLGLLLGPAVLAVVLLMPLPLTRPQHALVAILCFAMTYWVMEAMPVPATALVVLALCVILNVPDTSGPAQSPGAVIFAGFSSPTIFLLIGGFILAQAMIKHGLNRRIALAVLSIPGVATSTSRVIVAFGLLGAMLSSVIANGAVATLLLPIAIGIDRSLCELIRARFPELARRSRLRFSTALMLMTAYGITVGGLLTPIGDPSNLIGREFIDREFHVHISFARWVVLAAPIVIVLFTVLCGLILLLNPPEVRRIPGTRQLITRERAELGPMTRGERNTLAAFLVSVTLWLLPTLTSMAWGADSSVHQVLQSRDDTAVAALVGSTLLFVLPISWRRRTFTLTWEEATKIDWGTILLIGTGLTMGKLMLSTGLAQVAGDSLARRIAGGSAWEVYLFVAALAVVISEMTSNTASVSIIVPIIPALGAASGLDPVMLALVAMFAATYGFMLPISTSANAVAYSSGAIPIRSMLRSGFLVDVSGVVIIVLGSRFMMQLLGAP